MKLYLTAILIILFASCSNKQYSFRQKVNVKKEHIVKKEKQPNSPNSKVFIDDSSATKPSTISASVIETFSSTNNFVEEVNPVVNLPLTLPKYTIQPSDTTISKPKANNQVKPNISIDKQSNPAAIFGIVGLFFSFAGILMLLISDRIEMVILSASMLLLLGMSLSLISYKKKPSIIAVAGITIASIVVIPLLFLIVIFIPIILMLEAKKNN